MEKSYIEIYQECTHKISQKIYSYNVLTKYGEGELHLCSKIRCLQIQNDELE